MRWALRLTRPGEQNDGAGRGRGIVTAGKAFTAASRPLLMKVGKKGGDPPLRNTAVPNRAPLTNPS